MIQFIELVPVEVINPCYEQEYKLFTDGIQFSPPSRFLDRHENKVIDGFFTWTDYETTKQIVFNNVAYSVECVGPKEYQQFTDDSDFMHNEFVQKIYIQKLP